MGNGYFGAPSSKMAANSIRNGPPTKQMIAVSAAQNAKKFSSLPGAKPDIIAKDRNEEHSDQHYEHTLLDTFAPRRDLFHRPAVLDIAATCRCAPAHE